jgi:hypothetical protein
VRCGIVEMSGESAHGFVLDERSCSSVGSIRLEMAKEVVTSVATAICGWRRGSKKGSLLHELERRA